MTPLCRWCGKPIDRSLVPYGRLCSKECREDFCDMAEVADQKDEEEDGDE